MTENLLQHHFPSPSSHHQQHQHQHQHHSHNVITSNNQRSLQDMVVIRDSNTDQLLSPLSVLVSGVKRSFIRCTIIDSGVEEICKMEIGLPTNVRHVAHVIFDRFHGFLGLPVEFQSDVPTRAPSASTKVFGVSTESMQLSHDARGNSVPTILLMMQQHLYNQGGLQTEGIFRINGENSQEEYVREQLNRGVVPEDVNIHCLAGLIKAWFRELPTGVLDSLSPEQVMQSRSEEECSQIVKLLPPTEAALLDWAINLMADVAQMEHLNKMSDRNIAVVFAPNMTQMSDPLTALMHAVQVMNFLKTLIAKTLRERQGAKTESVLRLDQEPSDENSKPSSIDLHLSRVNEVLRTENIRHEEFATQTVLEAQSRLTRDNIKTEIETVDALSSVKNLIPAGNTDSAYKFQSLTIKKGSNKRFMGQAVRYDDKSKEICITDHINSRLELFEAWL